MKPHKENIKRIHTDGFISNSKLDIKVGTNLGELKYEGYCQSCNIINCANNAGKFII